MSQQIATANMNNDSRTFMINGLIESPSVKAYTVCLKAPFECTILDCTHKTESGSGTFKITNDGANVMVLQDTSSSEATGSPSANATVASGATIKLEFSVATSITDFSFTIRLRRTEQP